MSVEWHGYEHPIFVPSNGRIMLVVERRADDDTPSVLLELPLPRSPERTTIVSVLAQRWSQADAPAMSHQHRPWRDLEEVCAYVTANPELCGIALADRLRELYTTIIPMDAADVEPDAEA